MPHRPWKPLALACVVSLVGIAMTLPNAAQAQAAAPVSASTAEPAPAKAATTSTATGTAAATAAPATAPPPTWRTTSTPAEQALDAVAFQKADAALATQFTDVQSVVVVLRGRVVYTYYRDGDAEKLRDTQSAAKSALSALLGAAIAQGHIRSVDQRVLELVPEWAPLNADPRAQRITLAHLLTLTAGFALDDPTGTARPLPAAEAWARPLGSDPGQTFAYDNSVLPLLTAVLEKATGMPLPDYARQQLVGPLQMAEPAYRNQGLHLRTLDMAKLGQLYLQRGQWEGGKPLLPESFVDASVRAQNAGGRPTGLPYGYLWWVIPSQAPRPTFMASGWGGQFIWVHPALDLVIATTATASAASAQRGHALGLIRNHLFAAARQRAAQEAGGVAPAPAGAASAVSSQNEAKSR